MKAATAFAAAGAQVMVLGPGELAQAHTRINGLMNELRESQEAFAQLRSERDSLLQERDQMAALLKLNEAGRIQDLIEQNMSLAKNLREANEKVDRLNRESNADKDATIDALRDLAIAKSQINRLHQDKRDQDKRLAELENRLKNEEKILSTGQASADPAEVEVLRDIIKRQLRVQERRRQARDLLVEAAKELGVPAAQIPASTSRGVEKFFDGKVFDPKNPAAYLNSPSSMFGHTLLRIDLTGVHFSTPAPSPVPVTLPDGTLWLVRAATPSAGHSRSGCARNTANSINSEDTGTRVAAMKLPASSCGAVRRPPMGSRRRTCPITHPTP